MKYPKTIIQNEFYAFWETKNLVSFLNRVI